LKPYINICNCGEWYYPPDGSRPHPIFSVTDQQLEMLRDLNAGQQPYYPSGRRFERWHVKAGDLTPIKVDEMIRGYKKYYYTGERRGRCIFMVDLDCHEDWQDDLAAMYEDVRLVLGEGTFFFVKSSRGLNLHVKLDYHTRTPAEVNDALDKLQTLLKQYTARRKCAVEVKGKIATGDNKGTLAKLPCYGSWTEADLVRFQCQDPVSWVWLQDLIRRLQAKVQEQPEAEQREARRVVRAKGGSCTGIPLTKQDLALFPEAAKKYETLALYLYSRHVAPVRQDVKLTVEDLAYGCVVAAACSLFLKSDGSLPSKFAKLVWERAYQQGHFTRAFNDSRWSAIWKTISDCGVSKVLSSDYWHDPDSKDNSQCMRWSINNEYQVFTGGEERGGIIAAGLSLKDLAQLKPDLGRYRPGVHRPTRLPAPDPMVKAEEKLAEIVTGGPWWSP
jgi:hypothetical protein